MENTLYAIVEWNNLGFIKPFLSDGKYLMLFNSIEQADNYANKHPDSDSLRVISLDSVHE